MLGTSHTTIYQGLCLLLGTSPGFHRTASLAIHCYVAIGWDQYVALMCQSPKVTFLSIRCLIESKFGLVMTVISNGARVWSCLVLIKLFFCCPAIFSRAAVVCMTLGFITLLSMVIVAVYKSNQQKHSMKGLNKTIQGMYFLWYLFPICC